MVFSDGLAETGVALRNVVKGAQLCWTERVENVGMIVEEVLKKRDLVYQACHRICQLGVGISTKTYIVCDYRQSRQAVEA